MLFEKPRVFEYLLKTTVWRLIGVDYYMSEELDCQRRGGKRGIDAGGKDVDCACYRRRKVSCVSHEICYDVSFSHYAVVKRYLEVFNLYAWITGFVDVREVL